MVQSRVKSAARKAGLSEKSVHALRHTFCSHLAMRGAPARAIQEAAGHRELGTTQRYMHLSPALDDAIRLLEFQVPPSRGEMLETGSEAERNLNA
jgi:site-specific recombinase XerD